MLDQSSKVEKLDAPMLNSTIEFILDQTESPKFIVISKFKSDLKIKDSHQFEVKELEKRHAAKLLLSLASQYIEERNKDLSLLQEHKVFNLISRNPGAIIRFAQFLRSSNSVLDMGMRKEENQIKEMSFQDKEQAVDMSEPSYVMEQSFNVLYSQYPKDIEVLFVLCQLPAGAFESDLDQLVGQKHKNWKQFINATINSCMIGAKNSYQNLSSDLSVFWLVSFTIIDNTHHYVPF